MLKQLAILTFLYSWTLTFAQEPIRYTTMQGLPSNHIYDIQEDTDGFMWFATNRGLAKFDGDTFKTFTLQDGLPNNDTWLLDLDAQGRLWYFSKSSYQGYIINDSIYKFQTDDKKVISPRFNYKGESMVCFFSESGMQTVSGNKIKGIGLYSDLNSKKDYLRLNQKIEKRNLIPKSIFFNPENSELAVLSQEEIYFYNSNSLAFVSSTALNLPDTFTANYISNRGSIFNDISFLAFDKGVLFTNFKSKTSSYLPCKKFSNSETTDYLKVKGLKDEIQVSFPGHLIILNYNLEIVNSYSFPKITNNRISYKDSNGHIWLASFTSGVTLIPNTQLQSKYYLQGKKTQKLGVINDQLKVGIQNDGFYTYSKPKDSFESIVKNIGTSHNEIYKIKSNPNYLISGIKSFEYDNNNTTQIIINYNGLGDTKRISFKDIIHYDSITYYVEANYILEKIKNRTEVKISKSGLLQGIVFNDELYFGGSDGLHKLKNDSLVKPILENDLLDISINTMMAKGNDIWLGTDGRGVYRYNEENVVQLEETDGLSIQRIIKENNILWLATQKGVVKVKLNLDSIENSKVVDAFYEADGLLQNNTNDIYIEKNYLYAASDIGLAKLDLENEMYKQEPKLYFKSQADTLNFENSKRENISVTFAAQNFGNHENLNYEYRLLPIQSGWTSTESKALNFTNLSPDLYTLELRGKDQHNNAKIIKQYLNVIPKWWQTRIALFVFGVIALGILLCFIELLRRRIRNKERNKVEQDKRLVGLELQSLRSQMNPHFVHNSLNAIQYFIQRKEVELSEDYLAKFSKLIRLFFEYSRRQTITIREELTLLTYYLEIEKLRFEEKLKFTITVSENIDQEEQLIPSMLLQPLVENAVNHGLFHKRGNGIIKIEFKQLEKNTLKVTVKDDGIGINKAKEIYKNSSKNYQSNSSTVLQERLELLNQSKEWEISYAIQDRSHVVNEEGTLVVLTLKQLAA